MYKIVSIEDDILLAKELQTYFEKYGYSFFIVEDFEHVLETIDEIQPHVVLLDVNLPVKDGFLFCKDIRTHSDVPIIMLSSRDQKMDQMMGLNLGADDYITKPIDVEVLLLKIQAVIRRAYTEVSFEERTTITIDNFILDTQHFKLLYNNKSEELTKNETKILQKLMQSPDTYVHRDELMRYLWDNEAFVDDNTLNVNLSRVRKKIIELSGEDVIETKRSVGYRFTSESGELF